jgi:Fic family protein
MVLRSRGVARRTLVPVSLILATFADEYVRNLSATRYVGDPTSAAAVDGLNGWLAFFAGCCTRAVVDASSFEANVQKIVTDWRGRLSTLRSDSSALRLVSALTATPVVTARSVEESLGVSPPTANATIQVLVDADILRQVRAGRRSRAFEAHEIVDAFARLERQLASPPGDTF